VNCAPGDPASPAQRAGIQTGDKIIAIGGHPVSNWTQIGDAIKAEPAGQPVTFTIDRNGTILRKQVTLAQPTWHKGAFLGVETQPTYITASPIAGLGQAGSQFGSIVTQSASAFSQIPKAIPYLFAKNRVNTPGGQVSSVVGAAGIAGQVVSAGIGWQQKVGDILLEVAALNIFVGLFNLLPLLPLDGGHLAVLGWESLRSWWARRRGQPDPGPVDVVRLAPIAYTVLGLLVALSLLLLAADIINPVDLNL
jgi:RIP metalloprotease RseP